jgi:hypothetical protein
VFRSLCVTAPTPSDLTDRLVSASVYTTGSHACLSRRRTSLVLVGLPRSLLGLPFWSPLYSQSSNTSGQPYILLEVWICVGCFQLLGNLLPVITEVSKVFLSTASFILLILTGLLLVFSGYTLEVHLAGYTAPSLWRLCLNGILFLHGDRSSDCTRFS